MKEMLKTLAKENTAALILGIAFLLGCICLMIGMLVLAAQLIPAFSCLASGVALAGH